MSRDPKTQPSATEASRLQGLRRRTTALFLGGVGVGSIGLTAAIITSSLAAEQISHDTTWSGLPAALSILGTAAGTAILAEVMQRIGRRNGLVCGYALAILGSVAAVIAVRNGSLLLLIAGMFTLGLGRSGDSLSRYLVADLYPVERRASAIGWMVWVGTIGAVIGPNSLEPAGRLAAALGLPDLAGAFLVTLGAYGLAAALYTLLLRPDPATLVYREQETEEPSAREPVRRLFNNPKIRTALSVLVIGHVVMVLIMSMTPLNLKQAGHGLGAIGFVMSSHIIGMFLFSPLTGRLVDRLGPLPVVVAGQLTLLLAAVAALLIPASQVGLVAGALFLLGLGWNLGFVAGSALLSSGLALDRRARLQGVSDSMIWASAALASASSGLILATFGYDALCLLGALLIAIPATVLLRYRQALVHSPSGSTR